MIKAKIYSILWLLGCIYFFLFSDSFLALFLLITSLAVFAVCKILTVLTKKKLSFELKVQHTAAKGKPAKGVLAVKILLYFLPPEFDAFLLFITV